MTLKYIQLLNYGYTGHIHSTAQHPITGDTYHAVGHSVNIGGKSQRNLDIVKRDAKTGVYSYIKQYKEGVDYQGPAGACSAILIKNGNILVMLAAGNDKSEVRAAEDVLIGVHPPYGTFTNSMKRRTTTVVTTIKNTSKAVKSHFIK